MSEPREAAPRWEVALECGADGLVTRVHGASEHHLGITPDALVGTDVGSLVHPDDAFAGIGPVDVRVRHPDGAWRLVEWVGGTRGGARTVWLRDVTDGRALREEVELLRDRLDRVTGNAEASRRELDAQESAIGALVRDEPLTETLAAIVELVEAVVAPLHAAILVFDEHDVIAREASATALAADWHRRPELLATLRASSNGWLELEADDGPARLFHWSHAIDSPHGPLGALIVTSRHQRFPSEEERRISEVAVRLARVVLERRRAVERLDHRDRHDPLTGLPNRVAFMESLEPALRRLPARGMLAVLCVDLDHFQHVNDAFGHGVGDRILLDVGLRLRSALRSTDVLTRFGGDEFTALCHVDGIEHARLVAERMQRELDRPFVVADTVVALTSSIGIAVSTAEPDEPAAAAESMVRDADTALHRAKANGRARVELFDDKWRADLLVRIDTESALRGALDRRELELHYQPVFRIADGSIEGFEALLRWRRDDGTVSLPGDFVGLAEETGLIVPIGAWVLEEAARQSVRWKRLRPAAPPRVLSVNLSARQLAAPGFVDEVRAMLEHSGADPASLYLEITEGVLVGDLDVTIAVLRELRDLGLRIVIDDFGTGYSSLRYLKRIPVDTLKIDRSFVAEIDRSAPDLAIARAVVDVAHAFGCSVVAEGVERPEQLAALRGLGCEGAQGFLLGHPQPAAEIEALLLSPAGRPGDSAAPASG